MSNDVAKFGVSLDFTKAMQGLAKLKQEFRTLNAMQSKMNGVRKGGGVISQSKQARVFKEETERAYERELQHERNLVSIRKEGKRKPNAVDPSVKASLDAEKERLKIIKQEKMQQEALDKAIAKDANKALRADKARLQALERAKEAISNSALMMKIEANAAERTAQAKIRSAIASAKTASELRKAVATEKASLRNMQKKSFLMQRMESSSKNFAGNMVSAFAVAATGAFITRTGQDFEAVGNTMLSVSKDTKEAGDNLKYAKEEAYRLGLGLKESSKGFAKLLAARGDMSLDDTKNLFSGVSEMGTILGLTAEEGGRALTAVQQMASKGVISAEELSY